MRRAREELCRRGTGRLFVCRRREGSEGEDEGLRRLAGSEERVRWMGERPVRK